SSRKRVKYGIRTKIYFSVAQGEIYDNPRALPAACRQYANGRRMMDGSIKTGFVIAAPEQVGIEVRGSTDRFPVRRIYCVGRNYKAHVEEMGGSVDRDPPIFFQKPTDAVVPSG